MATVPADLPASTSVAIIGAGITGLSLAYHLMQRGMTDIVVLERESIASGETSKGVGGIRQQFMQTDAVELSVESVAFYEELAAQTRPSMFRQAGYLFLLHTQDEITRFESAIAMQNRLGAPSEMLSPAEMRTQFPMLDVSSTKAGAYCSTDGFGDPVAVAHVLAERLRDAGIRIQERTTVVAIEEAHGSVQGVVTSNGSIATHCVVNAAGPWARSVGTLSGLDIPLTVRPRQVFTLDPLDSFVRPFPFTVDISSGVYVADRGDHLLLGGGDKDVPTSDVATLDWNRLDSTLSAATRWLPRLAETRARSGWSGLRETTPDQLPILGPAPGHDGMWLAVGLSGHGFMHAPAIGRLMAEWIDSGQSGHIRGDRYSISRFAQTKSSPSTEGAVF